MFKRTWGLNALRTVARTFPSLVVCVEDTGHIYGRVHTTLGEIVCTHTF